ncbi:hypothetical protein HYC85_009619 [Camellia sinensis]|uniref:Extra-large guanine nucleotide-binding protein 1-like n=1 Tax=Camellia sinensis TaxID=4442 RepID=A0A7J7HGD4_CAMSI|nr:hypothetical protein HYC85_009619 [Camellia sinensis]
MVISCKSINLVSEISCGKGEDCSDESPCNVNMMSAMTSFDPESSDIIVHEGTYQDEPQIVYVKKGLCHRCLKGSCFTEKVVCIVCGARYCSNCVLRAMGSMPEGRKCITCVSSPVHESRRGTLGKCSWGLKQLLTDLNVKQIMRAEISCEANQLPSEVVYVNGKPLCHEELVRLQTCPNPPKKLKPGMYWYDKISGFWGKEGQKPCQIISAQLEVGDSIKRNASNGNTNILINNREITKAELWMLQWSGILCEGNLHLWLSKDGSYQEEGQNNVAGRTKLWDKTGTKLVCALLSLPIPPEHANSSGKEVVNLGNGVVLNYLAQKTLNKFLLVGYDKSGTSTIFKQARMVYNVCFSEDERQNIKPMIQSSLYGYLVILLEARERFEEECLTEMRKKSIDKPGPSGSGGQIDEKNIYSINPRLKAFSDWLLQEMISGNLEVIFPAASHAYAPVVEELWKDRALQATYNRRNEICMLPKVANYFLDRAVEISRTDYEPSDMDILYAEGSTSSNGLVCMEFSFPKSTQDSFMDPADQNDLLQRYQLIRFHASNLEENCKWLEMFEDIDLILYCVALPDYNQFSDDDNGVSTNKMLVSKKLFENIVTHPNFHQKDFILILSEFDVFEEKIEQVPLSQCEWFHDFNPVISIHHNSSTSNNYNNSSLAQCAFHYIAVKYKRLFNSLTGGRKLYVSLVTGLEPDSVDETLRYAREILKWNELSMQSNVTDEETQVPGPKRPGHVRTYGLSSSLTDVIGGGYRQSQEQTQIIQMQLQEQFNQYRVQLEMQMKEMMGAMRTEMQDTIQSQQTVIQAQQTRVEHLEYQLQAMSGPVAPAATPLDSLHNRHVPRASSTHRTATWSEPVPHSQQQSHASTSSFNYQRGERRRKSSRWDKLLGPDFLSVLGYNLVENCGGSGGGDPFGCTGISCLPSHDGIAFHFLYMLQKAEILFCFMRWVVDFMLCSWS